MDEISLCDSEMRLMNVIWDEAPVESGRLVKLSKERLDWSKSTTYTILRKLVGKGLAANEDSLVTVLIPRENVQVMESNKVVEKSFGGSLPKFVAAFLGNKSLSDEEADELIKLINRHKE
ncbi:MAG: BlaI/MecI/CopY family transcriptional regulator [Lachnospiraceae bacterium]|nr:BlaI/MecI/CopY family transcriptional regulator [Lachnospiraceae bacterium]